MSTISIFSDRRVQLLFGHNHQRLACGCLAWFACATASSVSAQEALYNSITEDAAAQARINQAKSLPYTVKYGDFRLLAVPSFGVDWNDNVNAARTGAEEDFILEPFLQTDISYPITERNLLTVNFGAGYDYYIHYNQYSTWFLQSGTELSFDIKVKNFWINLHEQPQYVRDVSQQPLVSGTATYTTFNNTAGLDATWNLNKATVSAGYDHLNTIATPETFASENGATEMVFARAGFQAYPGITTGAEVSGAFASYDEMVLNDNNNYSIGPYLTWQPDQDLKLQVRGGYTTTQFQHTSQSIQTSSLNSWYADVTISHRTTHRIGYSLDAGHEVQSGIQSDAVEDWYARPAIHWNILKNFGFDTTLSYEHGQQGVGNITGNLTETFDWLTASVSASYLIMKRLSLSLSYTRTVRLSNIPSNEYGQDLVGLLLTYKTL